MLMNSHPLPPLGGTCPAVGSTRSVPPARLIAWLAVAWDAWREALAARRRYYRLAARGVPHDIALIETLGIHVPAADARAACTPATPQPPATTAQRNDPPCRQSAQRPCRLESAHIGNLTFAR
jgi:hypothetical protein